MEPLKLRAGPLSLVYQPERLFLRYINYQGREALRGVYPALRDRHWGTPPPVVSSLKLDREPDSFRLSLKAGWRVNEIDFRSEVQLAGETDGTIVYQFEGTARSVFQKARLGFCVLHGHQCAGQPCRVEHADGSAEEGRFPAEISPHQPFFDIRAVTHPLGAGMEMETRMEGDIFEMEDQRNWTDASFKTYCTPHRLPSPVELKPGDKVAQTITIRLKGSDDRLDFAAAEKQPDIIIHVDGAAAKPLPAIGLCWPPGETEALTEKERARLKALRLSHLRLDLPLANPGWEKLAAAPLKEAGALELPLELALTAGEDGERQISALAERLAAASAKVCRWILFPAGGKKDLENWVKTIRTAADKTGLGGTIGTGARGDFAELNRRRPSPENLDFICYGVCPQVHVSDNESMVETLAVQEQTVENARRFTNGLPVAVTPVMLTRLKHLPLSRDEKKLSAGSLPPGADARQVSLFGAAWTAGSLKALAESGAASATYHGARGWTGVMERQEGSPAPELFPSRPGGVFPLYHVFAAAGEFRGGEVLPAASSRPWETACLVLKSDKRIRILAVNYRRQEKKLRIKCPGNPKSVEILNLTETTKAAAMTAPEAFRNDKTACSLAVPGELHLTLAPHALAQVDCHQKEPS